MNIIEALNTLGLKSGASQADIRRAYRELSKKWHPDFFQHDDDAARRCNKKTKAINLAFEVLENYKPDQEARSNQSQSTSKQSTSSDAYRGANQQKSASSNAGQSHTKSDSGEDASQESRNGRQANYSNRNQSESSKNRHSETKADHQARNRTGQASLFKNAALPITLTFGVGFIWLLIILGSVGPAQPNNGLGIKGNSFRSTKSNPYTATTRKNRKNRQRLKIVGKRTEEKQLGKELDLPLAPMPKQILYESSKAVKAVPAAKHRANSSRKLLTEGFFLGSTEDDVIFFQGKPDKAQGNEWFYGKVSGRQSIISFKDNIVFEWDERSEVPLKLCCRKATGSSSDWPPNFSGGSSLLHVAAVQGPPNRIDQNKWFYGQGASRQSTVTFSEDAVIQWKINNQNPLNVAGLKRGSALSPSSLSCNKANHLFYAINTKQDLKKAEQLYQLAAESHNPAACVSVGMMYWFGTALTKGGQWTKGDRLFGQASLNARSLANQYDVDGMFAFAVMLRTGKPSSMQQNVPAAHEWLREAASLKHIPSMIELAEDLSDIEVSNQTRIRISQLLKRAADAGSAEALVGLAETLLDSNNDEAIKMLLKAKDNNVASAYLAVGYALQDEKLSPIEKSISADGLAFEMFRFGIKADPNPASENTLAMISCLSKGRGTIKDESSAADHLLKAALYNSPAAQWRLAEWISEGKVWKGNAKTASTWYKSSYEEFSEAAARGSYDSAYLCGLFCEQGLGVEKNIPKAIAWWKRASESYKPYTKRIAAEKIKLYQADVNGK